MLARVLRKLQLNFVGRAVAKASMPEVHGIGSGRLQLEAVATHNTVVGGEVYPMAAALSHHLSLLYRDRLAAGPATLELGAGTGAVGLYAAALGAKCTLSDKNIARAALQPQSYGGEGDVEVIAGTSSILIDMLWRNAVSKNKPDSLSPASAAQTTDWPRLPEACSGAERSLRRARWAQAACFRHRRNAAANAAHFAHQPSVRTMDWSDAADLASAHATSPDAAGFGLLLGSDITYEKATHTSLVAAIKRLLLPTEAGVAPSVALIAHEARRVDMWGADVQLRSFEDAALEGGLQVQRSRLRCDEGSEGYLLQLTLGVLENNER